MKYIDILDVLMQDIEICEFKDVINGKGNIAKSIKKIENINLRILTVLSYIIKSRGRKILSISSFCSLYGVKKKRLINILNNIENLEIINPSPNPNKEPKIWKYKKCPSSTQQK